MGTGYGCEIREAGFDVDCFGFQTGFAQFSGYSFDEDAEFLLELFAVGYVLREGCFGSYGLLFSFGNYISIVLAPGELEEGVGV